MGVFTRFKKHEQENPPAEQASTPPMPTAPLATETGAEGDLPSLEDLPPLEDDISSMDAQSPLGSAPTPPAQEEHHDIKPPKNPLENPIPIHEELPIPHEYEEGPEDLPHKDEPVEKEKEEQPPVFDEPVHMDGKIHIPEPKDDELIVSEVYVEKEHFVELLSALHIARHEVEHNVEGKSNIDTTQAKLQEQMKKLHKLFDSMQEKTLTIENEIAKQQG